MCKNFETHVIPTFLVKWLIHLMLPLFALLFFFFLYIWIISQEITSVEGVFHTVSFLVCLIGIWKDRLAGRKVIDCMLIMYKKGGNADGIDQFFFIWMLISCVFIPLYIFLSTEDGAQSWPRSTWQKFIINNCGTRCPDGAPWQLWHLSRRQRSNIHNIQFNNTLRVILIFHYPSCIN